jgi:hypothetical protein
MLTEFEDHFVVASGIRIQRAGDGLSEAMDVAPVELHHGDTVHVVLRCRVARVAYEPVKNSDDELIRVHTLKAVSGTIVDEQVVHDVLEEHRQAVEKARGVERLPIDEDGDQ